MHSLSEKFTTYFIIYSNWLKYQVLQISGSNRRYLPRAYLRFLAVNFIHAFNFGFIFCETVMLAQAVAVDNRAVFILFSKEKFI